MITLHNSSAGRFIGTCLVAFSLLGAASVAAEPDANGSLKHEVLRSLDRGKDWLIRHQDPKGFWITAEHPATTALALVALQAGEPNPDARPAIEAGYRFILSCAQPDGSFQNGKGLANYNTALCLLALSAAPDAAKQPEFKAAALKARAFLIASQVDLGEKGRTDDAMDGGIGYGSKYQHSDMGNTLSALEALYYSKRFTTDAPGAPQLNYAAAISFLQNCQNLPSHNQQAWVTGDPQNQGGFIYYPGHSMAGTTNLANGRVALRSYGSISYGGMLSYIYAGLQKEDPRVTAVVDWLGKNYTLEENPGMGPQGLFFYFHTLSKALSISGLDRFETSAGGVNWREQLALKLMNLQKADGSWVNDNARWWEKETPLVTSYSVLALQRIAAGL